MAAILLASVPFWLSYQNFWVAMSEGLTAFEAFSSSQRTLIATVYAVAAVITIAVSILYWRVAGLLRRSTTLPFR
jgi:hypothetical protein